MADIAYVFETPPNVDEFIAFMGLRASKLALCAFDVYVGFARTTAHNQLLSRTHIVESLGRVYDFDTIDRSLQRLEAHGMIEWVVPPKGCGGNGAYYLACPKSAWHAYDTAVVERRRERSEGRARGENAHGGAPPAPS